MKKLLWTTLCLLSGPAWATTWFTAPSVTLTQGTTAHAADVMTDFNAIITQGNAAYNNLTAQIAALSPGTTIPVGAILNFNLSSCPNGYTQTSALNGTFARGWDYSGSVDPGRAIATYQGSQIQNHGHTANSATGIASSGPTSLSNPSYGTSLSVTYSFNLGGVNVQTGGVTGASVGSDTYPSYYVLLFCNR
jgi:hypothetical protein